MKNLRKVLAVVLVIALAFSVMAVASATYTDDSNVNYKTAVGVMTGIGVLNEMFGRQFRPHRVSHPR